MKKLSIIAIIILCANNLFAQQGIGVINPNASSVLEVASTKKGVLLPRMSTVQINAIIAPAQGLMVIDTTVNCIKMFDGVSWECAKKLSQEPWYDKATGNPADNNNQDLYTQGSVGIGNFGARTKLDVSGNIRATNSGPLATNGTGLEMFYTSIPPMGSIGTIDRATTTYKPTNIFGMNVRFTTGVVPSEKMRIDSVGNVGIGTTNPNTILHIEGATSTSNLLKFTNPNTGNTVTDGADFAFYSTNDFLIRNRENAGIIFETNGATNEKMRLTAVGNLGIGTSNPNYNLEVSSIGIPTILITDPNATSGAGFPRLAFKDNEYAADKKIWDIRLSNGLCFGDINDAETLYNTRMIIKPTTGNVGIGLNNPNAKFQVENDGLNYTGFFNNSNAANATPALYASTIGTHNAGYFNVNNTANTQAAVFGTTNGSGAGVYGNNTSGTVGAGGYFQSNNSVSGSYALFGYNSATGTAGGAFLAQSVNGKYLAGPYSNSVYGGISSGDFWVAGTLSKTAGSFKIDHPQDPANKYLIHSFVESPDMMNIYNGNSTTDSAGNATIILPTYFEALNMEFRYQLTIMDKDNFAMARVTKEIETNKFEIKTSLPNIKVSWQVTGIRHDEYANANRIENEKNKAPEHIGKYIHPELFNQPKEKGILYIDPSTILQKNLPQE
jgi:hypothetical protein